MAPSTDTLDPPADLAEARAQTDSIEAAALAHNAKVDADAKPKRTRAPRSRAGRARAPKPKPDKTPRAPRAKAPTVALRTKLQEAITSIGFLVSIVNPADGQAIMSGAAKQAEALDKWARANPAVRASLERMLAASVYGELLFAFMPTLLAIGANHRVFGDASPMVGMFAGMGSGAAPDAEAAAAAAQLIDLARKPPAPASDAGGANDGDGAPFGRVTGADTVARVP